MSFGCRAERDVDQCSWCESNKPTHSNTAGQEGKGATVHSGVRVRSRTVPRIRVPGLSFRFGAVPFVKYQSKLVDTIKVMICVFSKLIFNVGNP